jgi:hypothetical protein
MKCPHCSNKVILPGGLNETGLAVIGESPGPKDVQQGVPFTGMYGQILRNEFNKAGLTFDLGVYTNLWQHIVHDTMWDDGVHYQWHRARLMEQIADCTHVLMIGTELANVFTGQGVGEIVGLELESKWLPPGVGATFLPLPSSILHGGVGEFRLGIQKFAERSRSA